MTSLNMLATVPLTISISHSIMSAWSVKRVAYSTGSRKILVPSAAVAVASKPGPRPPASALIIIGSTNKISIGEESIPRPMWVQTTSMAPTSAGASK
jgi:hypothetical protein